MQTHNRLTGAVRSAGKQSSSVLKKTLDELPQSFVPLCTSQDAVDVHVCPDLYKIHRNWWRNDDHLKLNISNNHRALTAAFSRSTTDRPRRESPQVRGQKIRLIKVFTTKKMRGKRKAEGKSKEATGENLQNKKLLTKTGTDSLAPD